MTRRRGTTSAFRIRAGAGPPYFLLYLLIQALAVAGIPPGEFPDTASYLQLSLTGADVRLPTVPLLYKIFPTDETRMWAQVVLAALAWWALASVVAALIVDRRVRVGIRIVVLALGLASPIVNWNSLMLSESASISLTALLIAAWIHFQQGPSRERAGGAILVTLFWTFARQPHVLLVLIPAAALVVSAIRARRHRALLAGVGVAVILIAAAGFLEVHRNQTISERNIGAMIQMRVLLNRGWTHWFVTHGMPYNAALANDAGIPFNHTAEDPAFISWLYSRGTSTYVRFMLENLDYTFVRPLSFFPGEQPSLTVSGRSPFEPNTTPSLLSPVVDYGRHRNVVPSVLDRLLFDQGEIGDILALALVGIVCGVAAHRRYGWDRRLLVPLIAAASAVPQGYVVWLGGGEAVGELDRLSMITAVSLRIGLWTIVAVTVDRLLSGSS